MSPTARFQYEGNATLVLELLPAKRKLALVLQAPDHFVGVRLTEEEIAELVFRLEDMAMRLQALRGKG